MFFKHNLSLIMHFRCSYNILLEPGMDESLQLIIAWENSSFKKLSYSMGKQDLHLFRINLFMLWNWAELKDEWRACHKSSNSRHRFPLYLIVFIAGIFRLLTKFISFHGPLFLLAISRIFRSKNSLFDCLTVFRKVFQLSIFLENL